MNNTSHILNNNIDASHIVSKDHDIMHEDDFDDDFKKDLGLEYESTSHATSTPAESNSPPKLRSYLDEVIDSVIQDAIDYAEAPQEKRILPALIRKSTKTKVKSVTISSSSSINTFTNAVSTPQQLSSINNSGLALPTNNNVNNNTTSFHPLVQANFPVGMQQMLQLASTGKSVLSMGVGSNASTPSLQQSLNTTQQQQMANAMMGFSAAQLPNMIMPSYATNLQSNYSQQSSNGQYQLPVSLSQIPLAQPQQSPHLLLGGNNQNSFSDLSQTANGGGGGSGGGGSGNTNNPSNINFGTGISNANQSLMQSPYANFGSNSSLSVSPYQIPGMIQAYTQAGTTDNPNVTNPISQNESINSPVNLNTNAISVSCFHSTKSNNNNNPLTLNAMSNNHSNSTISSVAASLYQNNPFDIQQNQIYAHQRLLQAQHQQNTTPPVALFPDYAAVMARYGGYH